MEVWRLNQLDTSHAGALRYLQRDPFKHILHLKMLTYFADLVQTKHIVEHEVEGVLLLFPTRALSYDHNAYPAYQWVAMPVADSPAVFNQLLDFVPRSNVVFKVLQPEDEARIKRRFAGGRVRRFLNFSTRNRSDFKLDPDVVVEAKLNKDLMATFSQSGRHSPEDLARIFADGGMALSIAHEGRRVSVGMVYRSFEHIWEIAALYTIPSERRKGHAMRIVRSALHVLHKSSFVPRYVVDDVNLPSIQLARKIRLYEFVSVTHYAHPPQGTDRMAPSFSASEG